MVKNLLYSIRSAKVARQAVLSIFNINNKNYFFFFCCGSVCKGIRKMVRFWRKSPNFVILLFLFCNRVLIFGLVIRHSRSRRAEHNGI